jgi:hypothetical protein
MELRIECMHCDQPGETTECPTGSHGIYRIALPKGWRIVESAEGRYRIFCPSCAPGTKKQERNDLPPPKGKEEP